MNSSAEMLYAPLRPVYAIASSGTRPTAPPWAQSEISLSAGMLSVSPAHISTTSSDSSPRNPDFV